MNRYLGNKFAYLGLAVFYVSKRWVIELLEMITFDEEDGITLNT